MQMNDGIVRQITFNSPQGGHTPLVVREQNGQKITLRQCIDAWQEMHGFRHTLEQYHFSINAVNVNDMDRELAYVNNEELVATLAKVGGSN
jgi:hypothetical protein